MYYKSKVVFNKFLQQLKCFLYLNLQYDNVYLFSISDYMVSRSILWLIKSSNKLRQTSNLLYELWVTIMASVDQDLYNFFFFNEWRHFSVSYKFMKCWNLWVKCNSNMLFYTIIKSFVYFTERFLLQTSILQ